MLNNHGEKRKKSRLPCLQDCYYLQLNKKDKHKFNLKNISVTGACIESNIKLKNDEIIDLHISCQIEVIFSARVIWERDKTYGVLFLLESSEDLKNISFVMNNIRFDEKSS